MISTWSADWKYTYLATEATGIAAGLCTNGGLRPGLQRRNMHLLCIRGLGGGRRHDEAI